MDIQITNEIKKTIGMFGDLNTNKYETFLSFLYLKYKMINAKNDNYKQAIESLGDEDITLFIKSILDKFESDRISDILDSITDNHDSLKQIALSQEIFSNYNMRSSKQLETPQEIIDLSLAILNPSSNSTFADACSGLGAVSIGAKTHDNSLSITQIEKNAINVILAKMRCGICDIDCEFENKSWFDCDIKFDNIIVDYTFGLLTRGEKSISKTLFKQLGLNADARITRQDILFMLKAINLLNEGGKVVTFCTKLFSNNHIDMPWRKILIENGYVETVISLPEHIFPGVSIPINLLVLSKGNKSIKFIDASEIYSKQARNIKVLSKSDISKIMEEYHDNDSEKSMVLDFEYLRENEYCLDPVRELNRPLDLSDGQELSNLILNISRGYQIRRGELDKLFASEPTINKYLMVGDLDTHLDFSKLQSIKNIDSSLFKYCLKENNIILSKTGPKYKVSIARHVNDYKILATGNVYIIQVDENKINPIFMKIFLESELGQKQLNSLSTGSVVSSLQLTGLNHLIVPVPPLEKQNSIADKYEEIQEKIYLHKSAIERLNSEISCLF